MAMKTQRKRTQLHDLAQPEQVLRGEEMKNVQGGTSNLNSSKSNLPGDKKEVIICQRCGKVGVDKNPCCPPPSEPNL